MSLLSETLQLNLIPNFVVNSIPIQILLFITFLADVLEERGLKTYCRKERIGW
jgi:hypothetical protein